MVGVQPETDEQLVERVKEEGDLAFTELYHRYKHRVYAYCYRLLRHPQNAEDAAQETFLKIHRSLRQLETSTSLQAWIFTIARNEAFTILRRVKPLEDLEGVTDDIWDDQTPLDRVVARERSELLQHCLGLLRPAYREILILREYEQLSYAEIGRVTNLSESAVKSALFKARKAIGKKLETILKGKNDELRAI
jgi:RNA polymerase sigma-70 factor (ECF subfamily)